MCCFICFVFFILFECEVMSYFAKSSPCPTDAANLQPAEAASRASHVQQSAITRDDGDAEPDALDPRPLPRSRPTTQIGAQEQRAGAAAARDAAAADAAHASLANTAASAAADGASLADAADAVAADDAADDDAAA